MFLPLLTFEVLMFFYSNNGRFIVIEANFLKTNINKLSLDALKINWVLTKSHILAQIDII